MELAKLKALLGIEGDSKDVVLEFVIADVEEIIKNYCHVEEMPDGLQNTGYRMAMDLYRNENIGSETGAVGSVPQFPRAILLHHSVSMWMIISRIQC